MNHQDEFESLIKNFQLDDSQGRASRGQAPQPQRRPPAASASGGQRQQTARPEGSRAAVPQRPMASQQARRPSGVPQARQMAQPQAGQRPPVQSGAVGRSAAMVPQRTPAASQPARVPVPTAQQTGRRPPERRSFQVRIDEQEYYKPAGPIKSAGGGNGGDDPPDDEDWEEDEPSGFSRWAKALIALAVVLASSIFLSIFAIESAGDLFGLNQEDNEVEFTLTEGLSMGQIADQLKKAGVVSQPLTFQLYASLKNDTEDFVPGNYALNSNLSYDQILTKFRTGSYIQIETKVTFYEGMTLSEIANLLEEKNVCSAQDLYDYLEGDDLPDYDFIQEIPDDANRFRKFEGYFFPDTYIFYENMSPKGVAKKFLDNFAIKMSDEIVAEAQAQGMTIDQLITLASIIQKEAGDPEEMTKVSSVFHNRLNNPQMPRLQSDVTRDYVNNYIKPFLPDAVDKERNPDLQDPNQEMYDAYNTYVCTGLPVGPVCNPGMDAIEAALHPDQTNYYYFVTDEAGQYYYATSQAEHDQNVLVASGKGKVHGTDATDGEA